jgi:membrane protease YdiL (CAAX protease family)
MVLVRFRRTTESPTRILKSSSYRLAHLRPLELIAMARDALSRQISFLVVLAAWALVVSLAAMWGAYLGFGGLRFACALGVAALLFGFELFLAVPKLQNFARSSFAGRGALLAPLLPLGAVLVYAVVVGVDAKWMLVGAAFVVLPALLAAASAGKPSGAWEDYAAAAMIWLPVQFRWMYRVFPYPPPLTHVLSVLLALATGVAALVLVRRLDGIGYSLEWRKNFAWNFGLHFVLLALIVVWLGTKLHFLSFAPSLARERHFPLSALGILFFTAWPEEFLFRGILQNLLSRTLKNDTAGLVVASVVFGLSHIAHAPYPNWKYVALASIAGLFYGRAWLQTKSLVPGTLIHALVDISWHLLFR